MNIYQTIKANLKQDAKEVKHTSDPRDKAYIRQVINDQTDAYCREIDWYAMKGKFSERKADQYKYWLQSLACTLHP